MLDIIFVELLGTFIFLAVIIISGHYKSNIVNSSGWIKIGLALSVVILAFGKISGCFNPVVSLMLYLNKDITSTHMTASIIGQFIGAILAYMYFKYININYPDKI
jgi:glycerol uptake facilitator-like aquaporin